MFDEYVIFHCPNCNEAHLVLLTDEGEAVAMLSLNKAQLVKFKHDVEVTAREIAKHIN